MPAGFVVVVKTFGSTNMDLWQPHIVTVTNLGGVNNFPEDPEPEFVSINENNVAVVTLQENNALVLIDLEVSDLFHNFSSIFAVILSHFPDSICGLKLFGWKR